MRALALVAFTFVLCTPGCAAVLEKDVIRASASSDLHPLREQQALDRAARLMDRHRVRFEPECLRCR